MDTNGLYRAADGAALRFFEQADKNNFQSERNGRPIFDTVLYVEVITPASKESSPVIELERTFSPESGIDTPLKSGQFEKYKAQIAAYRGDADSADYRGTPLSAWPTMDKAMIATLAEARVYTVDALAVVPDAQLPMLGNGGRSLRERAQHFLNAASGNAQGEAMAAEIVSLKEAIAKRDNDITQLSALLAAAQAQALNAAQMPVQQQQQSVAPPVVQQPAETPTTGRRRATTPAAPVSAEGGNGMPPII